MPVVGEETINLHTFGTEIAKGITCKRVKTKLRGIRTGQEIEVELLEMPTLYTSTMTTAGVVLRKAMEEKGMPLADTPLSGMEGRESGVLAGDYFWEIVTGKTKRINVNLVALESKFGWLIQGAMSVLNVMHEIRKTGVMHISIGEERVLSDQICSFWEMDSLGIQMETETKLSMEGEGAQKFFIQTIKEIGGRYEVRLPWRTENVTLSPNYKTALHRFNMLVKRFRNNQSFIIAIML